MMKSSYESRRDNKDYRILREKIRSSGEKFPKKHGEWYRLHLWGDHYLVLDTWNYTVYHYPNGAEPQDTNNLYQVVYVFYDKSGKPENYIGVNESMVSFWLAHIRAPESSEVVELRRRYDDLDFENDRRKDRLFELEEGIKRIIDNATSLDSIILELGILINYEPKDRHGALQN